ncbi:hypothetical protein Pfo_012541 [Paulownia fortunei]|nr:hypothetical protein Pfo_012541 [Paulownia fortunei]
MAGPNFYPTSPTRNGFTAFPIAGKVGILERQYQETVELYFFLIVKIKTRIQFHLVGCPLLSILCLRSRFLDILKQHHRDHQGQDVLFTGGAAGEVLVACLREVSVLYFKEDFELEDGPTFRAACPFRTSENIALQERLSQYLDVVELHLVREIFLHSSSFFEVQGQLQDLNGKIIEGCARVRELKETIRPLDSNLVGSARRIQELSMRCGDLVSLQNKQRLMLSVNLALSTLQLLVASADCIGALDITDILQHLLDGDELIGLHCSRNLRNHVAVLR